MLRGWQHFLLMSSCYHCSAQDPTLLFRPRPVPHDVGATFSESAHTQHVTWSVRPTPWTLEKYDPGGLVGQAVQQETLHLHHHGQQDGWIHKIIWKKEEWKNKDTTRKEEDRYNVHTYLQSWIYMHGYMHGYAWIYMHGISYRMDDADDARIDAIGRMVGCDQVGTYHLSSSCSIIAPGPICGV